MGLTMSERKTKICMHMEQQIFLNLFGSVEKVINNIPKSMLTIMTIYLIM